MIEILSTLQTKDNYFKYKDLVLKYNTDTDIGRIVQAIEHYYRDTGQQDLDWNTFETYFFVKNPMIKDERKMLFEGMFRKLAALSPGVAKSILDTFTERYYAQRIAFEAGEVAEGKPGKTLDAVADALQEYTAHAKIDDHRDEVAREDLDNLLKVTAPGTGLEWRLNCLNEAMGELPSGRIVLFGGRPDSGKSTMLMSESTYMAQQLPDDQCVLYFTNEEDREAYKPRIIQSLLGVDLTKLESDPAHYWSEYVRLLGGNEDKIMLIDKPGLSVHDIERWLSKVKAGLIVIDQLRNVEGFAKIEGIQRTEKLFKWVREIAKEYASVLTVGQLDTEADKEPYPPMRALYESKTAAQGTLDAFVTIGVVPGSVPPNARYIGVVKNKMPRPRNPMMRKGRFECMILEDIGRFR